MCLVLSKQCITCVWLCDLEALNLHSNVIFCNLQKLQNQSKFCLNVKICFSVYLDLGLISIKVHGKITAIQILHIRSNHDNANIIY